MRIKYDFHIHSCLSPCGDEEMTPYNLVNMAAIMGYDAIALTDHNTCLNCPAALEAGKNAGITVLPGMELCTCEEIHVICLFAELKSALEFSEYIRKTMPDIKNRADIFGNQFILDSADNIIGSEELLLTAASSVSINEALPLAKSFGGICFPAHIDRSSYSIISALGDFPPDCGFKLAEVTDKADLDILKNTYSHLNSLEFLTDSDSHYLENMPEGIHTIECKENSPTEIINTLTRGGINAETADAE